MSSRPSRGAARLAAILDALPDALVLVNANGTVVNANSIALEAFETPGTALVGRGLLDLLPHFDSRLIPGSMRRPGHADPRARTKPTRMVARRTDGAEFPVEVASANLENGQQAYDAHGYTGDELLMLVVRDLTGTIDTEAELARSQRQTEMILRAAAEGVVGTDTDGRIVLVNPAAAQILGYRASDLGGRELHTLVLHSRADGSPFPYDESPLADTLRSGRKHRVRGQVLFAKNGDQVSVDLTTAPVRDGDQLVGAVMTFTDRRPYESLLEERESAEKAHAEDRERLAEEHAAELTALRQRHVRELEELEEQQAERLAADEERYAALGEREKDRYEALAARHEQLLTLLGTSLRGPLEELRRELAALASDDAGQLWPEANQVLHHLTAGYSRITTLIDNVLGYQRLDTGAEGVSRTKAMLDAVVTAGVDGAVELIGPGRVQFAVHAPPIEAEVDPRLLATALAHLVADVAGVDATGNTPLSAAGGYLDNTVVVAAAQRGEVVRIEVRGPYAGGDPVHEPIVRGIVRAHGGVLQTHEVPGMSGSAYVLEVPIGGGAGAVPVAAAAPGAVPVPDAPAGDAPGPEAAPGDAEGIGATGPADALAGHEADAAVGGTAPDAGPATVGGRRRARRGSTDAFLESGAAPHPGDDGEGTDGAEDSAPTGRRRRRAAAAPGPAAPVPAQTPQNTQSTQTVQAAPGDPSGGTGRRRGRPAEIPGAGEGTAPQGAPTGVSEGAVVTAAEHAAGAAASRTGLGAAVPPHGVPVAPQGMPVAPQGLPPASAQPSLPPVSSQGASPQDASVPGGRRARRADGERHALPPALPAHSADEVVPDGSGQPTGRRRRALASANKRAAAQEAAPRQVFALPPAEADRPADPTGAGAADAGAMAADTTAGAPGDPGAVGVAGGPGVPGGPAVPGGPGVPTAAGAVPPGGLPTGRVRLPEQPAPGAARRAGAHPGAAVSHPAAGAQDDGRHDAAPHDRADDHTPPQPHPTETPTGRRRRAVPTQPDGQDASAGAAGPLPGAPLPMPGAPVAPVDPGTPVPPGAPGAPGAPVAARGTTAHAVAQPPQGGAPAAPPVSPAAPAPGDPAASAAPGATPPHGHAAPTAPPEGTLPPAGSTPPPAQLPPEHGHAADRATVGGQGLPAPRPWPGTGDTTSGAATPVPPAAPAPGAPLPTPSQGTPLPPEAPRAAQPLPAETGAPVDPDSTQGRAFSVRTLGQGVPFSRQAAQVQQQTAPAPRPAVTPAPQQPNNGSGRRRKLGTPPDPAAGRPEQGARPHPSAEQPPLAASPGTQPQPQAPEPGDGQARPVPGTEGVGRSYAIGAPDRNAAEGPEPLDGPGGAVEVADPPRPQPMDDELPPEPLDNPRRLLVWPAPDVSTQQALSDRGYRPVIVHSREEVDAQIAAFPAALFVDPLTGPITRTALQSLRQAAVAAEVPVLVTAGLGQASRDAAYGADPAVLLKALAPRDSEQHPPRVLLIEEHTEIALALTATLERRGMQVARAAGDADAVALAGQFRPNLVVMDLMRVHRRQAGIVDWLRANGRLNRTPLVVYTAAVDPADLPRLASGETVLFLAERSTSGEVQSRIVELLSRIGTN
ncbi:PAS domain-containing protein [Streptomyces sp. SID8352]|uniref:PAS domain-containing protein n=1 Tax=Streptomyces sp. SID8352 TaxID=2690338 RepID=UPI00139DD8B4|nr:PAS domain-containing protein [Streptomyces sp. SID8352]